MREKSLALSEDLNTFVEKNLEFISAVNSPTTFVIQKGIEDRCVKILAQQGVLDVVRVPQDKRQFQLRSLFVFRMWYVVKYPLLILE